MITLQLIYGYCVAINLVTLFVFGADKLSAVSGAWPALPGQRRSKRVSERALLVLALLGGSPGAILAMKLFRHKTIKPIFQLLLAGILLFQIVILYFFLHPTFIANTALTNPTNPLY